MSYTRRTFLHGGVAALAGTCLASSTATASAAKVQCLDYSRSFACGTSPVNNVRLWIESRTTIFDDEAHTSTTFYQCASCKSENTFGDKNLFYADNYDFIPIFGGGRCLIFRRLARISPRYRTTYTIVPPWGEPRMILHDAVDATQIDTFEGIRDATAAGLPLVTQTEIRNDQTHLRAVIECPSKTMNISLEKKMYQVDTGPVAFPDLTKRFEVPIECLSLAFVAFNAPHFADFVIEQPTPVVEDGQEKCKIYHYSSPVSLPAKNAVFALGKI